MLHLGAALDSISSCGAYLIVSSNLTIMSIYSNASTYGGSNAHRQSQSHRHQGSSQIYGAPPPQQQQGGRGGYPPAGADPTLWGFFNQVDADGSGSISVNELQQALVNGEHLVLLCSGISSAHAKTSGNWTSKLSHSHTQKPAWVVLVLRKR